MKNYTDETFLKGFTPELTNYLWTVGGTAETTYDKQKEKAEIVVMNDLVKRGFKLRQLQIPLWLRNSTSSATASGNEADSNEDILSRMRWVTIHLHMVTNPDLLLKINLLMMHMVNT